MAVDTEALKSKAIATLKGFTFSQLVIIGLLSVLGLTGAVFFMKWVSTPSYGVLLSGLEAKDAAAVTAKLQEDGVPYKLEAGGATVLVPQASLDKERIAVAAAGLPAGATQDGWAAFDKQGLTSSSFQQQVAYQRALEATLASSLQEIDGVTSAQIHLALPEKRLFSENQDAARASVLVQTKGTLSDSTVNAITHLVSSSVPGLSPKDVSITDGSGTLLTGDGTSTGKTDAARRGYEDALSAQVTSMFDTLLGPGRAVVRVNAELDTASTTIDSEVYDPTKTATLSQTQSNESYNPTPNASATPGGVVTAVPSPGVTGTATGGNGYNKSDSSSTTGVSKTVTRAVVAPGSVKRLTVSVAVDRNAKNAPPPADLQSMVASAVGLNPARGDTLSVTTPAFLQTETKDAAAPAAAKAGPLEMAQTYGPKAVGTLLLLFVGFGFLRTLKKGTSVDVPADQVRAAVEAGKKSSGGGALTGSAARSALPAGSLPAPRGNSDLLATLDENPDEVTGMLRGWMANVGGEQ